MKNLFVKTLFAALLLMPVAAAVSCSDSDGDYSFEEQRENALEGAVKAFVDNTVVPTYRSMADGSIRLLEACEEMQSALESNTLTEALVKSAGDAWIETRAHWELSEAFLYGAAEDYGIDPHIDSWPLDGVALQNLLNNAQMMSQIEDDPGYVTANLGYGLLGFHAVEYMLFETEGTSPKVSKPRSTSKFTHAEMVYLVAVAGDLCNNCILLEASWAGVDNLSVQKQEMLEEADMAPTKNYGQLMRNAGKVSTYVNYLDAAQEIIQGCIDIADEVGAQKIGRPAGLTSTEEGAEADKNYIESPYSLNSQTDFKNNIISIQRAYEGSDAGDASVSDWVRTIDPDLDARVRTSIQTAIDMIGGVTAQFESNASDSAWKAAGTYCVDNLEKALDEVWDALAAVR